MFLLVQLIKKQHFKERFWNWGLSILKVQIFFSSFKNHSTLLVGLANGLLCMTARRAQGRRRSEGGYLHRHSQDLTQGHRLKSRDRLTMYCFFLKI